MSEGCEFHDGISLSTVDPVCTGVDVVSWKIRMVGLLTILESRAVRFVRRGVEVRGRGQGCLMNTATDARAGFEDCD